MSILVTGATGFIGRHLVRCLVERGQAVTILVREAYGMGEPLPQPLATLRPQLRAVYADLRNARLTVRAVEEAAPEQIVHLAAAGATDPFLPINDALRNNLQGTLNLVQAAFAKTFATQQLIVARTPGERNAMNVYAASKAAAWNFCQMYARTEEWPIHGAMIFQAYGPGQPEKTLIPSAFAAALAGDDFPMTSGEQERDWVYVQDVVDGLMAMIGCGLRPGTTVELGTGQATSVAEVVHQIYRLASCGGRPRPGALPDRPGETAVQTAGVEHTAALIGWRAKHSLSRGLQLVLDALMQ